MFCPYCRQELPEDATFCNICGKRVHISQPDLGKATTGTLYQTPIESGIPQQAPLQELFVPTILPDVSSSSMPTPPTPVSLNAFQRFLVRAFQPSLAGNAVFGVVGASILAVIASVAVCLIILTVAHALVSSMPRMVSAINGVGSIDSVLGITVLHAPFRDSLQLFLVIQGIGEHIIYGTGASAYSVTFFMPLHGLLIVPSFFLTIGGYIAACTDLQNRVRRSFLRGAAIAIPYTVLLLIISSQVDGDFQVPAGSGSFLENLAMDKGTLLFFGIVWGILFGLLGASLKLAQGQWRHRLRRSLQATRHSQVAGMIVGGGSASGLGIGLSFLLLSALLVYTKISIPWLAGNLCLTGDWQTLTAWDIAQGPLHAVNLFFFLFGTPITIHTISAMRECFYTALPQTALTIRNGDLHLVQWFYLFLLIPALSLFCGGRASVAIARVQGIGPCAIQGLLIAVPFTLIMLLLALMSTVTNIWVFADNSGGSAVAHVQSAGVGVGDLLLWTLLSGAFFGAIGGMYEGSAAKNGGKQIFSRLSFLLGVVVWPLSKLLDRFYGMPLSVRHGSPRIFFYGAFFSTFFLTIIAALLGVVLIANNQIITLDQNLLVRNIVSVLFVAIPGLLLFSAGVMALAHDPLAESE
jgi:hypothetical protein